MEENIIFLDFDGVICVITNDNKTEHPGQQIKILRNIINKYNAKVVVISSWLGNGSAKNKRKINEFLSKYGITNIDFIDLNFEDSIFLGKNIPKRVIGIIDYLKKINNCNYIILDDEYHNDYKLLGLNYYKTNMWKGLTNKDVSKIHLKKANTKHLNNIEYHHRKLNIDEQKYYDMIKVLKLHVKKLYNIMRSNYMKEVNEIIEKLKHTKDKELQELLLGTYDITKFSTEDKKKILEVVYGESSAKSHSMVNKPKHDLNHTTYKVAQVLKTDTEKKHGIINDDYIMDSDIKGNNRTSVDKIIEKLKNTESKELQELLLGTYDITRFNTEDKRKILEIVYGNIYTNTQNEQIPNTKKLNKRKN